MGKCGRVCPGVRVWLLKNEVFAATLTAGRAVLRIFATRFRA